jgi:hypothetical protein
MQFRPWLWSLTGFTFGVFALAALHLARSSSEPGRAEARQARKAATVKSPRIRLASLTTEELEKIRHTPACIEIAFQKAQSELRQVLGPAFAGLGERELQYAFCTVVSHALAPYGENNALRFPELLLSPALNCSNYGLLAVYLARSFPRADDHDLRIRFVGWAGTTIDNHQMLFLDRADGSRSLLLDPTLGLIALTNFDAVASGQAVPPGRMVLFAPSVDRAVFEKSVLTALREGRLRPSDLLFYFDGPEHLLEHYGEPRYWPTPAACACRAQREAAESR